MTKNSAPCVACPQTFFLSFDNSTARERARRALAVNESSAVFISIRALDDLEGENRGSENRLLVGPVPRKMAKFNPRLSQILNKAFLPLRACNSSLQNTVEPLLRILKYSNDHTKYYSRQYIGR